MQFEQIYLLNYKAIREMNIQFGTGVNLLIGDNGVGKTTSFGRLPEWAEWNHENRN